MSASACGRCHACACVFVCTCMRIHMCVGIYVCAFFCSECCMHFGTGVLGTSAWVGVYVCMLHRRNFTPTYTSANTIAAGCAHMCICMCVYACICIWMRMCIYDVDLTCKRGSVGQSEGLSIPRSSVRFRLKPDTSNSHEFELHRPSNKGTKLLLKVIKAIIKKNMYIHTYVCKYIHICIYL